MDLVRIILSSNFTSFATFGRRDHSPPYSIFCDFPPRIHPNNTFCEDSQMGVSKPILLMFQNFCHLYIPQIKPIWNM